MSRVRLGVINLLFLSDLTSAQNAFSKDQDYSNRRGYLVVRPQTGAIVVRSKLRR